jgi:hypothetical protein
MFCASPDKTYKPMLYEPDIDAYVLRSNGGTTMSVAHTAQYRLAARRWSIDG